MKKVRVAFCRGDLSSNAEGPSLELKINEWLANHEDWDIRDIRLTPTGGGQAVAMIIYHATDEKGPRRVGF